MESYYTSRRSSRHHYTEHIFTSGKAWCLQQSFYFCRNQVARSFIISRKVLITVQIMMTNDVYDTCSISVAQCKVGICPQSAIHGVPIKTHWCVDGCHLVQYFAKLIFRLTPDLFARPFWYHMKMLSNSIFSHNAKYFMFYYSMCNIAANTDTVMQLIEETRVQFATWAIRESVATKMTSKLDKTRETVRAVVIQVRWESLEEHSHTRTWKWRCGGSSFSRCSWSLVLAGSD